MTTSLGSVLWFPEAFFPHEICLWKVIKINTNAFPPYLIFFNFREKPLITSSWPLYGGTSYVFKPITATWSGYTSSTAKTKNQVK